MDCTQHHRSPYLMKYAFKSLWQVQWISLDPRVQHLHEMQYKKHYVVPIIDVLGQHYSITRKAPSVVHVVQAL